MDFLATLFLESPIALGVFSFLLFAVALFARRAMRESAARTALPITLLVIALLFAVQHFVVTQRERVWRQLDIFIAAVERNDMAAIEDILADSYSAEGMDHAAMRAFIEDRLRALHVYDTRCTDRDVTVDGDRAEMDLLAGATVSIQGGVGDRHLGRWRISWVVESGQWKIAAILPRMIDMVQIGSLRELRAYTP
jgi:hypothetical protein